MQMETESLLCALGKPAFATHATHSNRRGEQERVLTSHRFNYSAIARSNLPHRRASQILLRIDCSENSSFPVIPNDTESFRNIWALLASEQSDLWFAEARGFTPTS